MSSKGITPYHCVTKSERFHTRNITAVSLSPSASFLATAGEDGTIFFYKILSKQAILFIHFEHPVYPTSMIWPLESRLVVGLSDGAVELYEFDSEQGTIQLAEVISKVQKRAISQLAYDLSPSRIATGAECTFEIYRRIIQKSGVVAWTLEASLVADSSDGGLISGLHFLGTPTGTLLITHARAGISLWDSERDLERQDYRGIASSDVWEDTLVLSCLEQTLEVLELLPNAPWFRTKNRVNIPRIEGRNFRTPVKMVSSTLVAVALSSGAVRVYDVSLRDYRLVTNGGDHLVSSIVASKEYFVIGTANEKNSSGSAIIYSQTKSASEVPQDDRTVAMHQHAQLHLEYLDRFKAKREHDRGRSCSPFLFLLATTVLVAVVAHLRGLTELDSLKSVLLGFIPPSSRFEATEVEFNSLSTPLKGALYQRQEEFPNTPPNPTPFISTATLDSESDSPQK